MGIGMGYIDAKGAIAWTVQADNGRMVQITNSNAYYCPTAPYCLLCPHSWKAHQDNKRYSQGETKGDQANFMMLDSNNGYLLTWNRGRIQVTIPLDATTNLPMMNGEGTYQGFHIFAAAFSSFPTIIKDNN